MTQAVLAERREQVQWLVINRPERGNALNAEVVAGLSAGLDAAEADEAVRAVVLTGAGGRVFCAGGDMQASADGAPFTANYADPANFVAALFKRMADCRLPIVARVNGAALAGGFGLLCACDMAVASNRAKFGTPEVTVGLFPMMIMPLMQRVLARRKLFEMCITGVAFSAEEALAMDVVNRIAEPDQLDAALDAFLKPVLAASPTAVRLGKMAFRAMQDMAIDQALEYAQLMLPNMAQTADAREGFAAFREKRPARWTGR